MTCHSHEPKSPVLLHQTITNINYNSLVQQNRKIALTINCLLQKLTIKSNTLSGDFEQQFGPRNKLIFKTSNAWGGCCDRGMLKLQIDGYIFMYHTQPMKFDQILSILTEWAYILIHSSLLAHNLEHPLVQQWHHEHPENSSSHNTHIHTKTPTYKKVFSFNPIIEHQTSKKSARCLSIEIFIEKKLNLSTQTWMQFFLQNMLHRQQRGEEMYNGTVRI